MGIIVNETVVINEECGFSIANYYINIKEIIIEATTKITYTYQTYFNKDARDNGKLPFTRMAKDIPVETVPPNLYEFVYTDLKTFYTSYVDA